MKRNLTYLLFLFICNIYAQENPIEIIKEKQANRVLFYRVNKTEKDFDVLFSVEGSYIRQSKRKPRLTRVPAASRVLLHSAIVERGKNPYFTYDLTVNDSLSRRS